MINRVDSGIATQPIKRKIEPSSTVKSNNSISSISDNKSMTPMQQLSQQDVQLTEDAAKQHIKRLVKNNRVLTYEKINQNNGVKKYLINTLGMSFNDEKSFNLAVRKFQMASGQLLGSGSGLKSYADGLFGKKTLSYMLTLKPETEDIVYNSETHNTSIEISSNMSLDDIRSIIAKFVKSEVPADKLSETTKSLRQFTSDYPHEKKLEIHGNIIEILTKKTVFFNTKELTQLSSSGTKPEEARVVAEKYLGRKMSDLEWNYLIRAVVAESSPNNKQEQAAIMGVILNRVNNKSYPDNVVSVLKQRNQFQAVTGTAANNHKPSTNFTNPTKKQMTSVVTSTQYLSSVNKSWLNFTSNDPRAYGKGTNPEFLAAMEKKGGKVIGGTIFGTV